MYIFSLCSYLQCYAIIHNLNERPPRPVSYQKIRRKKGTLLSVGSTVDSLVQMPESTLWSPQAAESSQQAIYSCSRVVPECFVQLKSCRSAP